MEAGSKKNSICTDKVDRELVTLYRKGDERAFVSLLDLHIALIKYWARVVLQKAYWANPEDLVQEGRIGLWDTAKVFDVSRKGNFDGWARRSCIGRMFDSAEVSLVKRALRKRLKKVAAAQDELMKQLGRMPTLVELAEATNLSVEQVDAALNALAAFTLPIDDADGSLANEDPYQFQLIGDALNQLTEDQAEVIIRYHFYGHELKEIAKALGKSNENIRQIHKRAKQKLRDIIYGKGNRRDGIRGH
ncbi:MAG TPA: sigma-70 family RNA polymerase sigma factor [Pyrinomonadaceae bacterium]|nr:sigma-70 family RNA polymerase sigma factor [Pyrinomonadaceae bacterium]